MSFKKRLLLCLACAVPPLLLVGALWWLDAAGKQAVADAQARIHAAGLPLTIDEIRPPQVPDADNAALVIKKIGPLLDALPNIDGKEFGEWEAVFKEAHASAYRLDEAGTQELAAVLETQQMRDVFALIRDAVAKKGYEAKIDYKKGLYAINSGPSILLRSAKLLRWHARLAASQGQMDAASDDVWAMATLAEFLADEPTLVSQLTRGTVWSLALDELEQLTTAGALSPAWNQRFADRLARLDLTGGYARSLDGERVRYGSFLFEELLSGKQSRADFLRSLEVDSSDRWLWTVRYWVPGSIHTEYADYLDRMRRVRLVVAQTSLDWATIEKRLKDASGNFPRSNLVVRAMVPTLAPITKGFWKTRAKIVSAQAGLALERYRAAKGGYPATLADLVPDFMPAVPLDIFTRKPLIYRPEPGGAVIYSFGPNLKDDGGVEDRNASPDKDDQGWSAGPAAARKFAPPPEPASP